MNSALTFMLNEFSVHAFALQDNKTFLNKKLNSISDFNVAKYSRTVQQRNENIYYSEVFYLTDLQ